MRVEAERQQADSVGLFSSSGEDPTRQPSKDGEGAARRPSTGSGLSHRSAKSGDSQRSLRRLNSYEWHYLSPLEKWKKFGRFPMKMVLHVLLAVIATYVFFVHTNKMVHHVNHSLSRFYTLYLGISGKYTDRKVLLYTPDDFNRTISRIREMYFVKAEEREFSISDFHKTQPDALTFALDRHDGTSLLFNVTRDERHDVDDVFKKHGFHFRSLGSVEFAQARVLVPMSDTSRRNHKIHRCLWWDLQFVLESVHSGRVDVRVKYSVSDCNGVQDIEMHIICGLLAAVSLLLEVRRMSRRQNTWPSTPEMRMAAQGLLDDSQASGLHRRIFDAWQPLSLLANVVQIVASVYAVCVPTANCYLRLNLLGLGAALAWINLVRYLAFFEPSCTLYYTLAFGVPKVVYFMLGVIPLFIAYTLMGLALWGFDVDWFTTPGKSAASLFAMLNGDTLLDAFFNLRDTNWPLAQLYLYSFLSMFIYVVLNVTITIMEDAYFLHGKGHTIKGRLPTNAPLEEDHENASHPATAHAEHHEKDMQVNRRLDSLAESMARLAETQQLILRRLDVMDGTSTGNMYSHSRQSSHDCFSQQEVIQRQMS